MKYSETTQNIYSQLYKIPNFNLTLTNSLVTIDFLDKKFSYQNANKELLLDDLSLAAQIIVAKYYDKWNTYISTVLSKNLPVGETTTTESVANSNDNVTAMDSPTNIPVSGQDAHSKVTTTVATAKNVGDLLSVYQKYSIYDMIDTDIRRTLFLNVY